MQSDTSPPIVLKDRTANPAPLGLLGFGMTTVLLNLHNAGVYPMDAMIIGMGIFYGGIAQIIAGIMEWRKGNTFGTTAFTSYGLFWLSLATILVFPKLGLAAAPSNTGMAAYLLIWGIFTACMFIGTLRITRHLQVIFSSLTVLFVLLALARYTENTVIGTVAGIEGIFCGGSAMYTAIRQVLE